jgi:hypothetical protein
MDHMLLPPEPSRVREERRYVQCCNDECLLFETELMIDVEVEHWPNRSIFVWTCETCGTENDGEYDPDDEIDWDSMREDY